MDESMRSFRFDFLTSGIITITALYIGLVLFPSHLNHDVSWILYSAREIFNGAEFGVDVIDVNPPLAWWLDIPSVIAAKIFSISLTLAFRLYVFALVGISLFLLWQSNKQIAKWQLAAAGMILIVMPGYDFGQREHLMAILVTPYLGSIVKSDKNSAISTRAVIGILAGIGICLKPYFLLIPICVEIYRVIKAGKILGILRIETISMFTVGIIYVAAALILAPAFFTDILPVASASYGAYNNPFLLVIKTLFTKSIFALLMVGTLIIAKVKWGAGQGFLAAGAGAALAVLVQSKGWDYQIFPVIAFLLLVFCLSAPPRTPSPFYLVGIILFCVSIAPQPVLLAVQTTSSVGPHKLVDRLAGRFSSLSKQQRTVFAFITSPRFIWPAILASKTRWTGTQCCVYLLPEAVNNPGNTKANANALLQLNEIANVLTREKPALILVNQAKHQAAFTKPNFDYLTYLKQQSRYAILFSQYKETKPIRHYRVFERR